MKTMILSFLLILSLNSFGETFTANQQLTGTVSSSSSVKVLEPYAVRNYLLIMNTGSYSIYAKMGGAHVSTEGVIIPAGGNWEPFNVPVDSIYLKGASASTYNLVEGKK